MKKGYFHIWWKDESQWHDHYSKKKDDYNIYSNIKYKLEHVQKKTISVGWDLNLTPLPYFNILHINKTR